MLRRVFMSFVAALPAACLTGEARAQERKTGTITGEIKSKKATPDGKNVIIEVLAPGEEKARPYHVIYDPAVKGPIKAVLHDVRAAKVGDVVMFDWTDTGHGPAMKTFKVLKKGSDGDGKVQ